MHPRPDLDHVAIEPEATGERPGPEIQTLFDLLQILGSCRRSIPLLEREADSSQRQPMWVLAKPRSGRSPLTIGIRDRASIHLERRHRILEPISVRVRG